MPIKQPTNFLVAQKVKFRSKNELELGSQRDCIWPNLESSQFLKLEEEVHIDTAPRILPEAL